MFIRGNKPAPVAGVRQIYGDRNDPEQLKEKLKNESFETIFDNNGRELSDTQLTDNWCSLNQSLDIPPTEGRPDKANNYPSAG